MCGTLGSFGAANAIRTHDLILTKDVLCLLSYSSIFCYPPFGDDVYYTYFVCKSQQFFSFWQQLKKYAGPADEYRSGV